MLRVENGVLCLQNCSRSWSGPCRVDSNAELQLIDRLDESVMFAPISRLRRALRELPDICYTERLGQRHRHYAHRMLGRGAPRPVQRGDEYFDRQPQLQLAL